MSELVSHRAPAAGDQGQLVAAGRADEHLDGAGGISGRQQRGGESQAGIRRDEVLLLQSAGQLHGLLRGRERGVEVPGRDCRRRADVQPPGEVLCIVREPSRLDAAVEDSIASASRPRMRYALPRVGTSVGNCCPVARPTASARSACAIVSS